MTTNSIPLQTWDCQGGLRITDIIHGPWWRWVTLSVCEKVSGCVMVGGDHSEASSDMVRSLPPSLSSDFPLQTPSSPSASYFFFYPLSCGEQRDTAIPACFFLPAGPSGLRSCLTLWREPASTHDLGGVGHGCAAVALLAPLIISP